MSISSKSVKSTKAGKKKPRGKPFKKNNPETGEVDTRINRNGQNAKFTEFHRMLDRIFTETQGKTETTVLESMVRDWIKSNDYNKQNKALEYYVGKVADELNVHSSEADEFLKQNIDLLTDGQIDRLGMGEKPWNIITEILRDAVTSKRQSNG